MAEQQTGEHYPYYRFMETPDKIYLEGRYWNANYKGICVVAVVTKGVDWAAYIGADDGRREDDCLKWTATNGPKLAERDAKHFFPEIKLPYRG
jgi:hypothetical protein